MTITYCGTLPIVTCDCGCQVGIYDNLGFGAQCEGCGQWYDGGGRPYDGPTEDDRAWMRKRRIDYLTGELRRAEI